MRASHIAILALTCLVCVRFTGAVVSPGAKVRLTQKGLDYAAKKAVEKLDIRGQHIPDQHGREHFAIGNVEYSVTGMAIQNFGTPAAKVTVNPGKGITCTATGASISLRGNWEYKYKLGFFKFKDSGSFDVNANSVSFSISFILGIGRNGNPTIKSTGCSSNVGNLGVVFHGGASWLYNLFRGAIANSLKKELTDVICTAATKGINVHAKKKLAELIFIAHVGDNNEMTLDYSLTQAPVFNPGYMDVMLKGEFAWTKAPTPPAFKPDTFQESTDASKMAIIWVSEYVGNSLSDAAFQQQRVQTNVSKSDFPEGEGDFLNTTCPTHKNGCIGSFLNNVSTDYSGATVMIQMEASNPPYIRITPYEISFHAEGEMDFYAKVTNFVKVHLLKLRVAADMNVVATIMGTVLKGKVTSLVPKIEVLDSKVGKISDMFLNAIIKMIADKYIVKHLNELGDKGIPIPNTKDLYFVNPVLTLNPGNLMIATDIKLSP